MPNGNGLEGVVTRVFTLVTEGVTTRRAGVCGCQARSSSGYVNLTSIRAAIRLSKSLIEMTL